MSITMIPLNKSPKNQKSKVLSIMLKGPQRRRIFDLGIINGTTLTTIGESPCGGLKSYEVRGAVIALRDEDAEKIIVKK
ncbi:MAG: FeoA family protein [Clostridia bacterium]|nr:FeoA family protein [Clostridia bacterium]